MATWPFAPPSRIIEPTAGTSTHWWTRCSPSGARSRPAWKIPNWRLRMVTNWRPALARKEELCEVEARIKLDPESVALRFERACLFNEMGQAEDAKQAYLDVLTRSPGHVGALNNLGTLLYFTGYRTAARSAYTEAIRQHPNQPMAHVNLGNLFLEAGELAAARERYEAALSIDSQFV